MKNLEIYRVEELNIEDLKIIEGGNPVLKWFGAYILGEIAELIVETPAAPIHSGSTYAPYPGVSVKVN